MLNRYRSFNAFVHIFEQNINKIFTRCWRLVITSRLSAESVKCSVAFSAHRLCSSGVIGSASKSFHSCIMEDWSFSNSSRRFVFSVFKNFTFCSSSRSWSSEGQPWKLSSCCGITKRLHSSSSSDRSRINDFRRSCFSYKTKAYLLGNLYNEWSQIFTLTKIVSSAFWSRMQVSKIQICTRISYDRYLRAM